MFLLLPRGVMGSEAQPTSPTSAVKSPFPLVQGIYLIFLPNSAQKT